MSGGCGVALDIWNVIRGHDGGKNVIPSSLILKGGILLLYCFEILDLRFWILISNLFEKSHLMSVYFISHLVSGLLFCDTSLIAYFVSFCCFLYLISYTRLRGRFFLPFFGVYDLCDNSAEEAYPHIKSDNARSHNIPHTTYYTR